MTRLVLYRMGAIPVFALAMIGFYKVTGAPLTTHQQLFSAFLSAAAVQVYLGYLQWRRLGPSNSPRR